MRMTILFVTQEGEEIVLLFQLRQTAGQAFANETERANSLAEPMQAARLLTILINKTRLVPI